MCVEYATGAEVITEISASIEKFTFLDATPLVFWSRVRLALVVLLTPITILWMGRSITIRPKQKGRNANVPIR